MQLNCFPNFDPATVCLSLPDAIPLLPSALSPPILLEPPHCTSLLQAGSVCMYGLLSSSWALFLSRSVSGIWMFFEMESLHEHEVNEVNLTFHSRRVHALHNGSAHGAKGYFVVFVFRNINIQNSRIPGQDLSTSLGRTPIHLMAGTARLWTAKDRDCKMTGNMRKVVSYLITIWCIVSCVMMKTRVMNHNPNH